MICVCLLFVVLVLSDAGANVLKEGVNKQFTASETRLRTHDPRLIAVVNNYFDTLVESMQQFAINNGLDPMELPDIKEGFRVGLLLLAVSGKLWLTEGVLTDFATLRRDGDAILEYRKKTLDVHFVIGFEDLIVGADEIQDVSPPDHICEQFLFVLRMIVFVITIVCALQLSYFSIVI